MTKGTWRQSGKQGKAETGHTCLGHAREKTLEATALGPLEKWVAMADVRLVGLGTWHSHCLGGPGLATAKSPKPGLHSACAEHRARTMAGPWSPVPFQGEVGAEEGAKTKTQVLFKWVLNKDPRGHSELRSGGRQAAAEPKPRHGKVHLEGTTGFSRGAEHCGSYPSPI